MPRPRARSGRRAPSRRRGLACSVALVGTLGLACGGDDGKAEATGDDAASGTTGEPVPMPAFAEPASGRLSVAATRTEDLALTVQGVVPGRTELVVDDRTLGTLGEGASEGRLEAESLLLRVRGSMVEGLHRMQLRNPSPDGPLVSEPVEVTITADLDLAPVVGPVEPSGLAVSRIAAFGRGDDALLVGLAPEDPEPRLHLVPRGETGWDAAGVRTVAAPGLALGPDERTLPVAALRRGREDGEPGRVRVAYRVGLPGSRIDLLDADWEAAAPELAPVASVTVAAALGDRPAEWSELGRPWLMADLLLTELWAPVDVESARPGDRTLVWSRVHDDAVALDAPQRVAVLADLVDLDRLGPALDRVADEAGAPEIATVRADQHRPLVLEHDPTGSVRIRPTALEDVERTFGFVDLPLVTVVGAFGSRTVAGLITSASGRMRVALLDDLGDGGLRETSLTDDDLPAFDEVSGEIAPGSVAGLTVFLVPYGAELPVHAVHTAGVRFEVTPLPDLQCDAVALAPSPDASGGLPLACARDGELWLGSLDAMPVP